MQPIISVFISAMIFVGSWGFSYGYTFDSKCFRHNYLIGREIGISETFVLTLNEDGTAQMNRDGHVLEGTWTNEDGLSEYSVTFPSEDLTYTMEVKDTTSQNFDEGMLVLGDWSNGYRAYCFTPVWKCGKCEAFNNSSYSWCPHCGTIKPD